MHNDVSRRDILETSNVGKLLFDIYVWKTPRVKVSHWKAGTPEINLRREITMNARVRESKPPEFQQNWIYIYTRVRHTIRLCLSSLSSPQLYNKRIFSADTPLASNHHRRHHAPSVLTKPSLFPVPRCPMWNISIVVTISHSPEPRLKKILNICDFFISKDYYFTFF